ncbi:MAG: transporter [Alphaproteobacteria bacterium]
MRSFRRVAAYAAVGASLGLLSTGVARAAEFNLGADDPIQRLKNEIDQIRLAQTRAKGPEAVGEAPARENSVQTTAVSGVLTRPGRLVIEPSIEYQHTDINRFVAGGVAILDTVLIGSFEATRADRDSVTATVAARYGVNDRMEVETRVPYVYRHDSTTNTILDSSTTTGRRTSSTTALGDVEFAARYQITSGQGDWPFLIGNIRVKTPTGLGPYDVKRDDRGVEKELATGSGFWAIEPSMTAIIPDDPVVFFANVGYLVNLPKSIDKTIGGSRIGEVQLGNAVRFGFGIGIGLNEKTSLSIGYSHDFIAKTRSKIDDRNVYSEDLTIGTLSFGMNHQFSDKRSMDVSIGIGVTEDSPNVRLTVKFPFGIDL